MLLMCTSICGQYNNYSWPGLHNKVSLIFLAALMCYEGVAGEYQNDRRVCGAFPLSELHVHVCHSMVSERLVTVWHYFSDEYYLGYYLAYKTSMTMTISVIRLVVHLGLFNILIKQ